MTLPPLHWSQLKHMARSPAHYRYFADNPPRATAPMLLGTDVHALVLGGPAPLVFDGKRRQGKAWDAFDEANPDAEIVTLPEHELAQRIAMAVMRDDAAMRALDGRHEYVLEWTIAGRRCAGRADVLSATMLADLKTGADVNPERFYWQAQKMHYFGQLGWYRDGIEAAGLPVPNVAALVCVETKPPHPVVVFELTANALDMGRKFARGLFERLRVCEESNAWPGYALGPVALDVPESEGVVLDFGEEDAA